MILKVLLILISIYLLFLVTFISFALYKRKTIRELFIKTVNFLNKNNITYWVDFGTLLGIHRDKDIILGDNDGDVCIPISEEKKLLDALKNSGNYFIKWDRLHWPAFRTYNKNIFIDLYLVTIDTQNQVVKIPDSTVDTPLKFLSSFQNVTMPLGKEILTFRQPTDWTNLLIFRYGKKWTEHTCKWYLGYFSLLDTKNPRN